ncbi:MAG TPA: hypothetical protein VML54_08830, partial [Candidatus Limnocylindrales bacterium]|nr:hypothetical protein [Candidatus Limnocylindrales bacterium]
MQAALARAGLAVEVAGARGGSSSCTYRFADPSEGLLIEASLAGSALEATEALASLRAMAREATELPGVGDEAFLTDRTTAGATSIRYRAGPFYGQVNLRGQHEARRDAAVAVARQWVERLGSVLASADAPATPTPAPARAQAAPPPTPVQPATPAATAERTEATPARTERTAPRPPLPPLAWADPDSLARARGLVPWTDAPVTDPDVPLLVQALRGVSLREVDSLFGDAEWPGAEALEDHLAEWTEAQRQHVRDSVRALQAEATTTPPSPGAAATPVGSFQLLRAGAAPRRGPSAPAYQLIPSEGSWKTGARAAAPPPVWYERPDTTRMDVPATQVGEITISFSGQSSVTYFRRPWEVGSRRSQEKRASRSRGPVTETTTIRFDHDIAVALCPGPDGIVTGGGTVGYGIIVHGQVGPRPLVYRVEGSAEVEIVGRVD